MQAESLLKTNTLENLSTMAIQHGQGTFTWADGTKYVGEWKDDYINMDKGLSRGQSGDKYVGGWKDGNQHGQGTFTKPDGTVEKGIWNKGKLVEPN